MSRSPRQNQYRRQLRAAAKGFDGYIVEYKKNYAPIQGWLKVVTILSWVFIISVMMLALVN